MKPRPWASITSSGRARAEGEEMTAPGSPWTPEEDRVAPIDGGGWRKRHRDCHAAQAQSGGGATACAPTRDQVGPFAARAEAEVEMTSPDTKALGDARRAGNPDLCRLPDIT